jgi:hypothetical protein
MRRWLMADKWRLGGDKRIIRHDQYQDDFLEPKSS